MTTPETLYLLLTSQAREALRTVEQVILDEVHAVAGTKRGAHLALSLERLEPWPTARRQRIGLSATQRPLATIAAFLGGVDREVRIVDAGSRKRFDLQVIVPVDDMNRPGDGLADDGDADPEQRHSIWPAIYPRLLELIRSHRSTLVFVNSRRLAERMAARLNELAGEELVLAHHGSIAREQRLGIEEALKDGRLPALVATSSLELGIDMGAIDLVIQIEGPPSVAAGLQRIGRAGHQVGERRRADLPEVPRRPARGGGGGRPDAGRGDRATRCRATRSTCWPSRSWPRRPWTPGRWATSTAMVTGRRASGARPRGHSTASSTCCPGATRPTNSPT